jgi:DNA-binding NarL/FixJ family response regulator
MTQQRAEPGAPTEPIAILLVDDNSILAEAMSRVIGRDARFRWLGWLETAETIVEYVREHRPSVILMDVDMPGVETFELVRTLATACPQSRVVMFSGHIREEFADAAVDAGAFGYLHKDDEIEVLLDNLVRVNAGEVVLSPLVRRMLWRT